jgi:hypothetical protein
LKLINKKMQLTNKKADQEVRLKSNPRLGWSSRLGAAAQAEPTPV